MSTAPEGAGTPEGPSPQRPPRAGRPATTAGGTQRSRSLLCGDRFEVGVSLLLIFRRGLILNACRKTILRLLRLQPLRERRFRTIECVGRLTSQLVPFREILLERFGARCRQCHPLPFKSEPDTAAGEARVVSP